jgi:hypothetical protein
MTPGGLKIGVAYTQKIQVSTNLFTAFFRAEPKGTNKLSTATHTTQLFQVKTAGVSNGITDMYLHATKRRMGPLFWEGGLRGLMAPNSKLKLGPKNGGAMCTPFLILGPGALTIGWLPPPIYY